MKTFYNVYAICGFAAIGGGLFGFDISSMSGVLGTEAYRNYFNSPSGTRQGGITASMPAGSLIGALCSSFLADRLSRRTAIQIAALIWIIGAIFQSASNGIPLLCIGRVVGGFAIGVCSAIVPVYQSEIAPKEIRGRVVSLQQWAITWGILIQYFIQYGSSFVDGGAKNPSQGTAAFRIPWGIQAVPGAILLVGLFFFPRSPRWLASKDRWEEALQVLAHLHGGGDMNHPKVLAEYKEIEDALRFEREVAETSFTALIKPRIVKRVILGMSIQAWSQLCGMNVMMYYIIFIMRGAGIADELLTASIQYIINVVMTLPAILYLDKFGRRPALLIGSFLMMTWLFTTGALQATYGHSNPNKADKDISWVVPKEHSAVSKAIVACSYLFVASFATTWGPTSWTYPSEIFPAKVRAKAVSLATASNWAWNCILAFAVPPLLWSINWKMYMIFGTFNGLALVHMFFAAPETKGKTLEEMDDVFDSGLPAWKAGKAGSRLDQITRDIEKGEVKVETKSHGHVEQVPVVEPKA
ncbi:general substrate transporter [Cucurbitaria berberidis CBS 394.84]|uniref:General substrate transporter n=1 Tax=Cucurbitaria berberidis CBS 394.84 TaxID=1168544 RepID=A0A9P4L4V1_9PLEO|nr:general substrate transporter [Cucurbitaria berberidis CBS 394.84]KAF1841910.1 general substrate transporter [Cucurbitaria berberidis CBS 394.84]